MATLSPALPKSPPIVGWATITALGLLVALTVVTWTTVSGRQASALVIAAGLGVALYHGAVGFTAHWRRWLVGREPEGLQSQLVLVGVGSLAMFPLIAGVVPGFSAGGAVAPLALELVLGALVFGLGMQLANGCGSGTLFTLGGGSTKMVLTLAAFVAGSLLGTLHLHLWRELPRLPPVSLIADFGLDGALLVQAAILLGLFVLLRRFARPGPRTAVGSAGAERWWRGPWPPYVAAAVLALLAALLFYVSHQPWGVTFGFALWGGKLYEAFGGDLSTVPFWSAGWARAALDESVLRNTTSVTNFGVILGAMLAAAVAGRFHPPLRIPLGHGLAAVIGGLLMGYGARLAFGCNIGAFIGGAMSGSLHGWLWLAAAVAGSWIGIRLRPHFGLANP